MIGTQLANQVQVFVPSTVDVDVQTDTSEWIDRVASQLSKWYGGATILHAYGAWLSHANVLVREDTTIVMSYCDDTSLAQHEADLESLALDMKSSLRQEAIAVTVNGALYLI